MSRCRVGFPLATGLLAAMLLSGCDSHRPGSDPAWAVNVGGPAYRAVDGTQFRAEESVSGGRIAVLDSVVGSQDSPLYETYREGDIRISHPLANGTYDLTFHFAEPAEIGAGQRVFDAFAEDRRVLRNVDVMSFRDGKVHAALSVTAPGITVNDGTLDVRFAASAREPLLSAIVVRRRHSLRAERVLAWSDEFDTPGAPDPRYWTIEEWPAGHVNDEDQAYTARHRNLRVEDGNLVIEAHREDYDGARYTSGRIHSDGKAEILYGRVEVRAKLPRGQGTWPAIWMLSSRPFRHATNCSEGVDWQGNEDCDAWPNSGEIDIMEHVGYLHGHVHGTVHGKTYNWTLWNQRKGRIVFDDVSDAFHVYVLEWTPERIDILVDDVVYMTFINEGNGWEEWPFDEPFHVILNFAVGGGWGRAGGPIDDSVFPQRMLVDYVRVYSTGG